MNPEELKIRDIKPALYGYVREAWSLLDPEAFPDEKKVHDLRVLMKKSRAVMKLAGPQTGKDFFDREYGTFRQAGKISATWRETSVHRKTLRDIKKKHPGLFVRLADNEKIAQLMKKPDTSGIPSEKTLEDIGLIREMLNKSAYRIRFRQMGNLDPILLLRQLESVFLQVTEYYITARNNPRPVRLHEFRKKTKDLLYQLWFFRPLKPGIIKSLEKKLTTLTDNLGKYNDLAVVLRELDYRYSPGRNVPALDELAIVIRQEQDRYLSRVWPTAYRIFRPGRQLSDILELKTD